MKALAFVDAVAVAFATVVVPALMLLMLVAAFRLKRALDSFDFFTTGTYWSDFVVLEAKM